MPVYGLLRRGLIGRRVYGLIFNAFAAMNGMSTYMPAGLDTRR